MAAAPQGQAGQFHTCRVCLGNNHPTPKCKYLQAETTLEFLKVRENNYLRISRARRFASSKPSYRSTPGASSSHADTTHLRLLRPSRLLSRKTDCGERLNSVFSASDRYEFQL